MNRIDTIQLSNFKFFKEEDALVLGGKHLLLFGENGSGKSSIYWALYTLFESSIKEQPEEIRKYFGKAIKKEDSLVNIHANEVTPESDNFNSFIEIITDDDEPITYRVSVDERDALEIMENTNARFTNYASDFISYKAIYNIQNFWHSKPIDLFEMFVNHILKHVNFSTTNITRDGVKKTLLNAFDLWSEILRGPEWVDSVRSKKPRKILSYKYSDEWYEFTALVDSFNDGMEKLIDYININGPKYLKKLGYNFEYQLEYKKVDFVKKEVVYNEIPGGISLKLHLYEDVENAIYKPHSFLNEAKLSAIGISIRLAIISQKLNEEVLKFLVLDDFMISLDMSNRDKVIDLLLDKENSFIDS